MNIFKKSALYILGLFPELLFKIRYYKATGIYLNINHPITLYDKIAYMLFRTNITKWSLLADKVAVREYLIHKGLADYIPRIYGVWSNTAEIDFKILPNSFVFKTNNACATNIIVKDKENLDVSKTCKKLNKWLKLDYGYYTAQPHYSKIKPLILAEEFLVDNETTAKGKLLIDYKFYCINGEPKYVQVMYDRKPNSHDFKIQLFDMDWGAHPNYLSDIHEHANINIKCPVSFEKMKDLVRVLSKEIPFVRVDLYEINERPMFGELTFTPGFDTFTPLFMEELGKSIKIQ